MTLAKVSPGQPLRIPAETFNAFVDAAAAFQASRTSRQAEGGATIPMAGVILVRNDSGADQERFAVLGLGAPLILPEENPTAFQERVALSAVTPDADLHADRCCILQEPIAAGALGRGLILGVTPVHLMVQAEADRMAAVVTDDTGSLQTGSAGIARILWKEPGTGPVWGIVQIPAGADGGSPNLVLAVTAVHHPWMVGDVLRWDGTAWVLADAAVVGATETLAVVGQIPDADTALLVLWGICCLEGLSDHTDYWLDPSVPGGLTPTQPPTNGRLVLHHAVDRLCLVRAGGGGSLGSGGGAERFADLTDVDVTSTPPADHQAPIWDAAAQRWKAHDVVLGDPVPAHRVLAGPTAGADAKPTFRDMAVADLAVQPGTSVVANAGGAAARPAAVAADTDGTVFLRLAGTLSWAQVPTTALEDHAVTSDKLADGSVSEPKLQRDAVSTLTIRDGAVTDAKIAAVSWWKLLGIPATFPPAPHVHDLGGALLGTTAAAEIAEGAVDTVALADGAVTGPKLAPSGVTAGSYGSATVVPVLTVDAQGRVTAATTQAMTPAWTNILGRPATFPPSTHSHTLGGDASGDLATSRVVGLQGKGIATAAGTLSATSGPALFLWWDRTNLAWTPMSRWNASAVTGWINCYDSTAGDTAARTTGVMAGMANSVLGRANAADGLPAAIPAAEGSILHRAPGGVLGFTTTIVLGKAGVGGSLGDLTVNASTSAVAAAWRLSGAANSLQATYIGTTVLELKAGSTQQIVCRNTTGTVGTVVQIDWSGGIPRLQLFRTDISTTVPLVDLNLSFVPTGGWTTAKALGLREIDVCDGGLAKKICILASQPYT